MNKKGLIFWPPEEINLFFFFIFIENYCIICAEVNMKKRGPKTNLLKNGTWINFLVPHQSAERLNKIALSAGLNRSQLMRKIVENFISSEKDKRSTGRMFFSE